MKPHSVKEIDAIFIESDVELFAPFILLKYACAYVYVYYVRIYALVRTHAHDM